MFDITQTKFSLFAPGINKPKGQRPYKDGTLMDVYEWMNSMKMQELTKRLRSINDEKEQKMFKTEHLPFVTFSGTFDYRKAESLKEHSQLQCFDFDHLASAEEVLRVKDVLSHDDTFETELLFTSPRGNGVKWVTHVDIDRATHEVWYEAVRNYLHARYGLEADPLPSNVASACFLCFDANLIINPNIAPF